MATQDSFARESAEWFAAVPEQVDERVEGVRQRIGRISRQFERVLAGAAEYAGVSVGDLEALSVLARAPRSASGLRPGTVADALGLTSGTVSVRLDRLAANELIESIDGSQKRRHLVRITDRGRDVWSQATVRRAQYEASLLRDILEESEIEQLEELLVRVLARLEGQFGPAPRHDMTRGRGRSAR